MESMIRQNDGFYKKISFFDQYSSLRSERVEFIVHTFPELYEILKKGSEKAREVAAKTLDEVKNAMKINYFSDEELIKVQSEKYSV